jgi:predicted ATP-grasp superfamily ATP-dependent carboligase
VSFSRFRSSAIVLGTEVNGIAVIRSLGRLGVRCAALSAPIRGDHTPTSRYLTFTQSVTRDAADATLIDVIRDVSRRLGAEAPVVLIPTTDRYSELLSRNLEVLGAQFIACCPDLDTAD